MGKQYTELSEEHIDFIGQQKMFFVGTAGAEGKVNLSPKGLDTFRVLDKSTVEWLNLTGSGNETAAHVLENGRMTIMFCSFDKQPLILRLYGHASFEGPDSPRFRESADRYGNPVGARQIFTMKIEMVQTSCGFAVPFYDFLGERKVLDDWATKKGEDGIREYWKEKNTRSLDGKKTGIKP